MKTNFIDAAQNLQVNTTWLHIKTFCSLFSRILHFVKAQLPRVKLVLPAECVFVIKDNCRKVIFLSPYLAEIEKLRVYF